MEATEPMSIEQAAESLLMPDENQSENETETEADEAPAVQPEPEELEADTDDEAEASTDDEDDDNAREESEETPNSITLAMASGQELTLSEDDFLELPDDAPIRYKVDGEWVTGTLGERRREESGQAYVQKGMSENAAKSKELAEQVQTLQSERQAVLQAFQALQSGNIIPQPQPPQIDANEDPIGWTQEQARYQSELAQWQQQQHSIQQLEAQNTAQQEQAQKAYLSEQRQKAVELIPELGDAEKAPKVMKDLLSAASHYGYEPDEMSGVTDARVLAVLKDAASYRALQSSTSKGLKKVEGARPVLKPGAKKAPNPKAAQKALKEKAKRNGSLEAWADTLAI